MTDGRHPRSASDVVTGNVYPKYNSRNPLARCLVARFRAILLDLFEVARPSSVLDVGTGDGELASAVGAENPTVGIHGIDLYAPTLLASWRERTLGNLSFSVGSAYAPGFARDSFDLVAFIEVLEHLDHPSSALREARRVARRWIVASVPREPLWRILNLARGAYVADWGDTPGHVNHWSKREFVELMKRFGQIARVEAPLPWSMVLIRVGP